MFPIRTVAAMTGIKPMTLRAWERRFKLITPIRTEKGHRLYSQEDVDKIMEILSLTKQGISISQVKRLLTIKKQSPEAEQTLINTWPYYLDCMLNAIKHFDETALDYYYSEALSLHSIDSICTELLIPLLKKLGDQWQDCKSGIAEEHFFSMYMRNKLGAHILHLNQHTTGPLLLIACLPGEEHETGMLLFALAALNNGYRALILGANLPLTQIAAIAEKRTCDAIVLSGFFPPTKDLFENQLPKLMSEVYVPVFIGGAIADRYETEIKASQAIYASASITIGLGIITAILKNQNYSL